MKKYTQNDRIPFTDDIMFSLVMHDEDICREFLQRILPDEEFGLPSVPGSIRPTWTWNISGKAASTASFPAHMSYLSALTTT